MEMDAAQSSAETAVAKYRAVTGRTDLDQDWDAVRTQCYEAAGIYLSLTVVDPDDPVRPPVTPDSVRYGDTLLRSATAQVSIFQDQYSRCLNTAAASITGIIVGAEQARAAAIQSQELRSGLAATFTSYPSICTAAEQLDGACTRLASARGALNYRDIAVAARDVNAAAAHLAAVVREAPARAEEAKRALSSISTRIDATRGRLADAAPAMSAMLKEFTAANSADLVGNAAAAAKHISTAADHLGSARAAQYNADPEEALTLAKQTRNVLTEADQLIAAIPTRLRMLRELRDNPKKAAEQTRFALHDAQMYAVSHGLTKQWASVLDTQLHRIETLEATLGCHPNYLAYTAGLDRVGEFIASVVTKMRDGVRGQGQPRRASAS